MREDRIAFALLCEEEDPLLLHGDEGFHIRILGSFFRPARELLAIAGAIDEDAILKMCAR